MTTYNSSGNIDGYKDTLLANDFTEKDGICYKVTFSLVSKNDSLGII